MPELCSEGLRLPSCMHYKMSEVCYKGLGLACWLKLYISFSKITFNFIILIKQTSTPIPVSQILDTLGKEQLVLLCARSATAFWGMYVCPGSVYLS